MTLAESTTIEKTEKINAALKERAVTLGAETWEDRLKTQTPACKFGDEGLCCRHCSMGPCRITGKAPRGVCGADAHAVAGRSYLRAIAAGVASHSDHARELLYVLREVSPDGHYKVTDEAKLLHLAAEWGVKTEGRNIYDIAHDTANVGLMEFGKPDGFMLFPKRATQERQELWKKEGLWPRAIDREVATSLHMTHMGNSADPTALVRQGLRTALSNGWGGSMLGTEVTDILFGTPVERKTEGNFGVLERDMVNIAIHGHDPAFSEMIVSATDLKEMQELAKQKGAAGINVIGICCTANEVTMRHGVRIPGSFLQQEHIVLTGVCDMMCVDVQCIFPSLPRLAECFHTKFVTTSPIARIPGAIHIEFNHSRALDQAKEIIGMAIDAYTRRDKAKIFIPDSGKHEAVVGYSVETIAGKLNAVNSDFEQTGVSRPIIDAIKAGILRGVVGIVGCNNPRIRFDYSHNTIMRELLKNNILIVSTGCAAQHAARFGLLDKEAKNLCGDGLKQVCELLDIPPILHMGSCVDISRILTLATVVAKDLGVGMSQLPVVGISPEWVSEKAVAIANYVVATGLDVYLGIEPQVKGSSQMMELITQGTRKITGAGFIINKDPHELAKSIINGIEEKRKALGL